MHAVDLPSPWVVRFAHLVAPGARVLDVACGAGRHAKLFAQRGATVDAVDRDLACATAFSGATGVTFLAADIEEGSWPYAGRRFDAVIVTNYLHRPLFSALFQALAPGGVLLYETFMVGNERFGHPSNPEFLLKDGELLDIVRGRFSVTAYEARMISEPKMAMVQRIAARLIGP